MPLSLRRRDWLAARCPKTFEERLPHPVGRWVRNGPARTSKTSAAVREVRPVRGAGGGADASEARADTKTGEQEIFYRSPSRLLFSCFRHGARRLPMPSVLLFPGPARGGSSCLLFSCSRLEHARRGAARNPSARGRAPAAQRRDAGARAEDAERAGGEALRTGVGCGTARHALQRIPRLSARSVPSAVPPEAGGRVQAFTSRSGPRRRPPRGSRRAGRESPRRPSSPRRRSGGRRPSARRRSRKAPSRQ